VAPWCFFLGKSGAAPHAELDAHPASARSSTAEHKAETIAIADHVVDLGPGAGTAGGTVCFEGTVEGAAGQGHHHRPPSRRPGRPSRIVFEGTPAELIADPSTLTGEHLAAYAAKTTSRTERGDSPIAGPGR